MPSTFTINTSPYDTSKFTFTWSKTSAAPVFTYKLKIKNALGNQEKIFSSNNSGRDTNITFSKSFLDSLGREFGFSNDSVICLARVFAYNGKEYVQGTGSPIFVIKTGTTGIVNISTNTPEKFGLHQNYPNPFNPATNIKFDINKSGFVSLTVFDITGKEVTKLVSQNLAAGTYDYDFNAAGLPSGIYFYKLETAGYSEVKKMTLIK
ncbi:MAG: T9SS type A sorting domain-containing protein [Ignavibacteria bacterium]|nr:T9SS type A sorting domain-containing protein [Ignavibacteria bacterium]